MDASAFLLANVNGADENKHERDAVKFWNLVRPGQGDEIHNVELEMLVVSPNYFIESPIHWTEQIHGRMSSTQQPWMRQRVK
jgi:hypothetical protein